MIRKFCLKDPYNRPPSNLELAEKINEIIDYLNEVREMNTKDISGYILFADQPTSDGRVYREEELRKMAENSTHLIYDEEQRAVRVTIPSCWIDHGLDFKNYLTMEEE